MLIELQAADLVLRAWKESPKLSKREIGVFYHWKDNNPKNDKPLTEKEVESFKNLLRDNAPTAYCGLFPEK